MMARNGDAVTTCSIAFKEKSYNEAEFAREVAARYRTQHHEDLVDSDDFGLVDALGGLYDEPYADSSAIPTYRVCELARKHVTVALSGDGGDELFAGYRRYRWHMHEEHWRARVPLSIRRPVFGALGRVYPKLDWAPRFLRAKTTFQALARDSVEAYRHSVSILRDAERAQLFSARLRHDLNGYSSAEVFAGHARNFHGTDPLKLIQYLDFKTYLVGDILTKVDRASMAHALEVRVPLLDHELIEWAMPLPSALKLSGHEGKHLLKKAMEPHLPNDVLYRTKMGFSVPLTEWFRGPLRQRVRDGVLSSAMRDSELFDMRYIESLVDQHQSGQSEFSAPLWSLLMFDSFLRRSLA
jgi:asparagine synthase (glutamine-hydrolysing)